MPSQWTGTCKGELDAADAHRHHTTLSGLLSEASRIYRKMKPDGSTTAPIFNSLRRIDPAVALAISVPAKLTGVVGVKVELAFLVYWSSIAPLKPEPLEAWAHPGLFHCGRC